MNKKKISKVIFKGFSKIFSTRVTVTRPRTGRRRGCGSALAPGGTYRVPLRMPRHLRSLVRVWVLVWFGVGSPQMSWDP